MHTTSFTLTNTLQDLFSSNPSIGTMEDLRQECLQVFKEAGRVWTKEAVSKLHLLDSTIRESMRFSSFSVLALPRRVSIPHNVTFRCQVLKVYQVVAPEGIALDNNVRIPQGIPLATPMDSIHFDPDFYTDPTQFHPFRFCTQAQVEGTRTQRFYEAQNKDTMIPLNSGTSTSAKARSTVSLDDKFLAFGFGRNACPGRFFALHEIKLMMAYILMNYEVQHFPQRPEQFKIMWVQLPKESTHLKVRRRAETIW